MEFNNSPLETDIIRHWNETVVPLTEKIKREIKRDIRNLIFFKPTRITDISYYFQLVSNVLDILTAQVKNYDDKQFVINFLEQLKSETIKDFDAMEKLCSTYLKDTVKTIDDCRFELLTRTNDHSLRPA